MNRLGTMTALLRTFLLLLLSAFLPPLTFFILDHQLENEIMQREDTDISLKFSQNLDFFRTLDLFRSQQTQIELTEGYEGYRMTEADVSAAAKGMILSFGNVYSAPEVTPVLITNKDSLGLSGIFWRCVWGDDAGGQEIMWLDDQSGQMVGFQGRIMVSAETEIKSSDNSVAAFAESVYIMGDFCSTYYPVDDVFVTNKSLTTYTKSDGIVLDDYEIVLTRYQENLVETYHVSVRLRGDFIYFNI